MLILVGVTINVALNGGLFETANKAVKQTQKEADREILQAAVIAALNEQLKIENANAILKNLPDGWEVTGADGGPYICTSPKGNIFIVDQNGEITEPPELPEGLEEGKEFRMDADQDGTDETWIVLYKTASHLKTNEIEVISKNVMGETLTLGRGDESAQTPGDIDSDGTANSNVDKAIYSFENSVNRLNNYCKDLIKIGNLGVRSVGSNPSDKSYVNTAHTEDSLVTHLAAEWTDAGKTAWNKYKLLAGTTDTNSDTDYNKMITLGIRVANNSEGTATNYWLASRYVDEIWNPPSSNGYVVFNVRSVSTSGIRNYGSLWLVRSNGSTGTSYPANAVRPVIKLPYKY